MRVRDSKTSVSHTQRLSWDSTKVLQQGCPCAMLSVGLLPETSAYQLELAVYPGSRCPIAGIIGMQYACMHGSTYACFHVRVHVCMNEARMHACMHACTYACMYVRTYACMYVCMYVCM